jgi:hypothetical protein
MRFSLFRRRVSLLTSKLDGTTITRIINALKAVPHRVSRMISDTGRFCKFAVFTNIKLNNTDPTSNQRAAVTDLFLAFISIF